MGRLRVVWRRHVGGDTAWLVDKTRNQRPRIVDRGLWDVVRGGRLLVLVFPFLVIVAVGPC